MNPIDDYLSEAVTNLRGEEAESMRRELASHIEEKKRSFELQGLGPDEAARKAVESMGAAADVRAGLKKIHRGVWRLEVNWSRVWLPALAGFLACLAIWAGEWAAYVGIVAPELQAAARSNQSIITPDMVHGQGRGLTEWWVIGSYVATAIAIGAWCLRRRLQMIECLFVALPGLFVAFAQQAAGLLFVLIYLVPKDLQLAQKLGDHRTNVLDRELAHLTWLGLTLLALFATSTLLALASRRFRRTELHSVHSP